MKPRGIADSTTYGTVTGFQEAADEMVIPDTILPSQFADLRGEGKNLTPERLLMLAVLRDGIEVLAKTKPGSRCGLGPDSVPPSVVRREAIEWFESEDTEWPYSFVNICHVLNINPEYILRGLKQCKWAPDLPMVNQISYAHHHVTKKKTHKKKARREKYFKERRERLKKKHQFFII